jgi:hypothetical protein
MMNQANKNTNTNNNISLYGDCQRIKCEEEVYLPGAGKLSLCPKHAAELYKLYEAYKDECNVLWRNIPLEKLKYWVLKYLHQYLYASASSSISKYSNNKRISSSSFAVSIDDIFRSFFDFCDTADTETQNLIRTAIRLRHLNKLKWSDAGHQNAVSFSARRDLQKILQMFCSLNQINHQEFLIILSQRNNQEMLKNELRRNLNLLDEEILVRESEISRLEKELERKKELLGLKRARKQEYLAQLNEFENDVTEESPSLI